MKHIEILLKQYYDSGFTKHNHRVLLGRLQSIQKRIHISHSQIKALEKSIQYPLVNGAFVILLDLCTPTEFQRYIETSIVPRRLQKHIDAFHKSVLHHNKDTINIQTFKFPTFSHRKISYDKNSKPQLTSVIKR